MFKLFTHFVKQREYHKLFDEALSLSKQGSKEAAFDKFNLLLQQFPADVYVRRQVLNLGETLHKPVELPNISPRRT